MDSETALLIVKLLKDVNCNLEKLCLIEEVIKDAVAAFADALTQDDSDELEEDSGDEEWVPKNKR